jgi:hypothetical protein
MTENNGFNMCGKWILACTFYVTVQSVGPDDVYFDVLLQIQALQG